MMNNELKFWILRVASRPGTTHEPAVGTIGVFDGVHRGHRCLIERVKAEAAKRQMNSLLVTFPEHPAQVLRPDLSISLLTTADEKARLLSETGVDAVAMVPFTKELAAMSARDFMEKVLLEQLNVRVLVIGYDHRFGHGAGEGFADYVLYGQELGIEVMGADELEGGEHVSSSAIRQALGEGDVEAASRLLGYDYFVEGRVVDGFHVGRTIGYPTANIQPTSPNKLLPRRGVYAVRVVLPDGTTHLGMLNIGTRPTLDNGPDLSVEVNIFDFSGNIYSDLISVHFLRFIRNEKKFDTVAELLEQLKHDEREIRELQA